MAAHAISNDAFDRRLKPGHGVCAAATRIVAWVKASSDAKRTRTQLEQLTDRQLDDIGICRGDIRLICTRRLPV
ncbi:DUF1127 domain-containing protein [Salipiger sp. PrR003]|uniref:DUF1127 domain-containing protein n=1 Tax=Salipiger sp. PrR003 TaxID=2706776 RepID=UPI0013DA140A|nr:DUF1127 domain-containing protein [Salipiger sp. PrR003]NDV52268.1 DUF1127 domain-containing protein [Salipiger sp. PrR003]